MENIEPNVLILGIIEEIAWKKEKKKEYEKTWPDVN